MRMKPAEREAYYDRALKVWFDNPDMNFEMFCQRFNRLSSSGWTTVFNKRGHSTRRKTNWTETSKNAKTPERLPSPVIAARRQK